MGEEAATPGQPVALARALWVRPPAIHPREPPAAAGFAAIIRQAQELSRFASNTLSQIVARRKTKNLHRCAEAVDDDISLWKTEENQELLFGVHFASPRQKRKPRVSLGALDADLGTWVKEERHGRSRALHSFSLSP
jgi:hypothetical protein